MMRLLTSAFFHYCKISFVTEAENINMPDLNMSLSKDFKLWEFVKSVTAENHGIDNIPNTS